ncbi:hypothetical protein V5O48_000750 [Marasmius crinis-equi]|uniref:F-box domain-containing protein n=1 Tax=Marasmius crinis-equi TaxID=585013 RepID=A0ABR3G0A8_9AGAR
MAWTAHAPVERLPVELLSYIFVLGTHSTPSICEEASQESTSFNVDSIKTPLVFAAVNRHWRAVALNTPALWTSLCVTVGSLESASDTDNPRAPVLNTSHVTSYLALSRKHPLDILIDARDMDWDFYEPEIPNLHDHSNYIPPFSPRTMSAVISLLLPHITRWRSIDILTDTWAPMYAALNMLNESLTTVGAPLLESLTLMRCNDFISHSPQFQPRHMRSPLFLKPRATPNRPLSPGLIPRLQHLTLRGVHVCWSSLPTLLCVESSASLLTLELSSHCLDVRPSLEEFRAILSSCPLIRKLVVNGSGYALDNAKTKAHPTIRRNSLSASEIPIFLPHLEELSLGYRSTLDGRKVLSLIRAPNIRKLTLEDATHPGEYDGADATSILKYVATGDAGDRARSQSHHSAIFTPPVGGQDACADAGPSRRASAPSAESRSSASRSEGEPTSTYYQPFPFLETLTLKGVKADSDALKTFFLALVNLKSLILSNMLFPMSAFLALLPATRQPRGSGDLMQVNTLPRRPSAIPSGSLSNTAPVFTNPFSGLILPRRLSHETSQTSSPPPCPKLERLCIRGGQISPSDLGFITTSLAMEKERGGWSNLYNVDVHLDSASEMTIAEGLSHMGFNPLSSTCLSSPDADVVVLKIPLRCVGHMLEGIELKIVKSRPLYASSDEDDDDSSSVCDPCNDCNDNSPFRLGGEFNDPYFDSQFTGS